MVDRERPERALIGEDECELAVHGMLDVDAHPLMTFGGRARGAQQQLTAHAEVSDDGFTEVAVSVIRRDFERQPEELAAPRGRRDRAPAQRPLERGGIAGVAGQRPLVGDGDLRDPGAHDGGCETRADDLDLGKLRHRGQARSESACQSVSAAAISACFLLDPTPWRATSPTATVAVN